MIKMNFEQFRTELEINLQSVWAFELQEFHFQPHSFGNGILAYRIKGRNHKFIYDGRENELTWLVSQQHQKYFGADWEELKRIEGLNLTKEVLESALNNLKSK